MGGVNGQGLHMLEQSLAGLCGVEGKAQGLRTAGADPESAAKLAAIRRALGFGAKPQA